MAGLHIKVEGVCLETLDPDGGWARACRAMNSAGFPFFDPEKKQHASGIPSYVGKGLELLNAQNPNLRPVTTDSRIIMTGQQPGLLGGPLYTFLKAAGAIALARRVSDKTGMDVIPVFWIASEDHDIVEVSQVKVRGKKLTCEYEGPVIRNMIPQVGGIDLKGHRELIIGFLKNVLPKTEFSSWVMTVISECDFTDYASAFSTLFRQLFADHDFRLLDPRGLRPATAPVLAALVERWPEVKAAFDAGTAKLKEAGIDGGLDGPGFYEIVDGRRVRVECGDGRFRLSRGDLSFGDTAQIIRAHPEIFSPNAALRPVLQDAVLPVMVTMAGPSEICYLWQVHSICDVVGVKPSQLAPRVSATFISERTAASAKKTGVEAKDIIGISRILDNYRQNKTDDPKIKDIETRTSELLSIISSVCGESPSRQVARNQKAVSAGLNKLISRLKEERLEKQGVGRKRLERLSETVLPGGRLQERGANMLEFLNSYGPDFVRGVIDNINPLCRQHIIATLSNSRGG